MRVFTPGSELDAHLFQQLLIDAASSSNPTYIGEIQYDASYFEQWLAEGNARTAVNAKIGTAAANQLEQQKIPKVAYTTDELGRIGEGPIELLLGLDVEAVSETSTDPRPDKTIEGIKFDVKTATKRHEDKATFSLPQWTVRKGRYDALLLVQHQQPGHVRVWACKCQPDWQSWTPRSGKQGRSDYFVIACPDTVQ